MRLGILGGTFDPPHIGHLIVAEQAREQLRLDKVRFLPAGDPWRKAHRQVTEARHRLAMVELATEGNDAFEVDDSEIRRSGATYTIDSLRQIRADLAADDELFFLAGEDSLADLENWQEPGALAGLAYFVVAPREGASVSHELVPADRLLQIEMPYIGISSTLLRKMAALGKSLRYMVPSPVETYIRENSLYRS